MKKEIADKWVSALRSGEYKQGTGQLKFDDTFCCLGVLCDISDLGSWGRGNTYRTGEKVDGVTSYGGYLPPSVEAWAGLRTKQGVVGGPEIGGCDSLAAANDIGMRFAEIADYIEANWETL